MKLPAILAVAALSLSLGACSATGSLPGLIGASTSLGSPDASSGDTEGAIERLATFTVKDIRAADDDAVAHGDEISHACYPTLASFIEGLPKPGDSPDVGAFTTFQKARDIRNVVAAGIPKDLLLACSPLITEVRGDALGLLTHLPTTH